MVPRYTPHLPFLLVSALLAASTGVFLWRQRPKQGATAISITSFGIALWAVGQAASHATVAGANVAVTMGWFSLSQFGTALVPTSWLLFALRYTGHQELLSRSRVAALWSVPAAFVLLTVTNAGSFDAVSLGHQLVYVDPAIVDVNTATPSQFRFGWGVGVWVFVAESYALLAVANGLLLRKAVRSRNVYRRRSMFLFALSVSLWISHGLSVAGLSPLPHLMLGPVVFLLLGVSSLLVLSSDQFLRLLPVQRVFGSLHSRFSDTVPVARDLVIEEMGSGVIVLDSDNHVIDINPVARRMLGSDDERIVGRDLKRFVDESVFLTDETPFLEADAPEGTYEAVWAETDSGHRCFDVVVTDLASLDQDVSGRVAIVHDITEKKEREQELETQKAGLSELTRKVEELHTVAMDLQSCTTEREIYDLAIGAAEEILDFDWCVIAIATEGWLEITAVSDDSPFERGIREIKVDEGQAGEVYQSGDAMYTNAAQRDDVTKPISEEIRSSLTAPIGDVGVLQGISSEPEFFDDEHLELAELLASNVRAALERLRREQRLRTQQAELERQNERLEEFAGIVSHDLRSPLNLAQGQLDLAETHGDEQYFRKAERSLDRMNEIIDEVLSLAKQGQTVTETERFSLAEACETTWEYIETGPATLAADTDRVVEADRARLLHVFENLVRNALDHGPDDVTITVGDLPDGFYVADDGPGIPEDQRDEVFEKGYTTDEDGTGFGLSIVNAAVEAHGWEIRVVESEAGGARFEISGLADVEESTGETGDVAET